MLMLKEILAEVKFEKRKPNPFLIGVCVGVLYLRVWLAVFLFTGVYLIYISVKKRKHEVPELLCFLPMGEKTFSRYRLLKIYIETGLYSFAFLIAGVYCLAGREYALPYRGDMIGTVLMAVAFWLFSSVEMLENENARCRHMEKSQYRVVCCPLWYRVVSILAGCAMGVVFSLGAMWNYDFAADLFLEISNTQKAAVYWFGVGLCMIFLLISHIYMVRHLCRDGFLSDYNGKQIEV